MVDNEIILREANINDISILQYWDKQQHVIDCDPEDDDWDWDIELNRDPVWRKQLVAELNGKPIGFLQIIDPAEEETHYWGEVNSNLRAIDIWIGEKHDLGKGYGTIMMKLAFNICFKNEKITAVVIDPLETNVKAHKFYERIGFKFVEKRKFDDSNCLIYQLTRLDWKLNI